jgi:hypothetical protein
MLVPRTATECPFVVVSIRAAGDRYEMPVTRPLSAVPLRADITVALCHTNAGCKSPFFLRKQEGFRL